ncbi:MAG: hypothetical protein V4684_19330 [Pseudomonadota bacterium]
MEDSIAYKAGYAAYGKFRLQANPYAEGCQDHDYWEAGISAAFYDLAW